MDKLNHIQGLKWLARARDRKLTGITSRLPWCLLIGTIPIRLIPAPGLQKSRGKGKLCLLLPGYGPGL